MCRQTFVDAAMSVSVRRQHRALVIILPDLGRVGSLYDPRGPRSNGKVDR